MMRGRRTQPWAVTLYSVLSCALGVLLVLVPAGCQHRIAAHRALTVSLRVPGYFSLRGLPPIKGVLMLSDAGVAFVSAGNMVIVSYRTLSGVAATEPGGKAASCARLSYSGRIGSRVSYVFRFRDGVFETENPGPLRHVLAETLLLGDPARSTLPGAERHRAALSIIQTLATSSYADTLYTLFGRPRGAGFVGDRGVRAGDLAEYVSGRDSVALDPARMTGEAQLRHAFAHELAHRWELRSPRVVDSILSGSGGIADRDRYGYLNDAEQRAEAIAFAVHFLQSTASGGMPAPDALELLRHYDFLVPGSRSMVRYLMRQPCYQHHPLRMNVSGTV
jgi:hypothetical protein